MMTRNDFYRKLVRYLLLSALILIVLLLGRKLVYGADCNGCPGKNACNGRSGCEDFYGKKNT
ncbi:MAG TPA: hypothetical protein VK213_00540 [Bacteroidales bacterium]|nr:hypothetical protein [Bacteroidales bacterium]